MRAVLDVNILISAMLAPNGSPARIMRAWLDGKFEIVISPQLLAEFQRATTYPKLRDRIGESDAYEIADLLCRGADLIDDPEEPLALSPDPDDDYLLALAAASHAVLVSGDRHLLGLASDLPVYSPSTFMALIGEI